MELLFTQFYFKYSFSKHNENKKNILNYYVNKKNFSKDHSWICNTKISKLDDFSHIQVMLEEIFEKFSSELKKEIQITVCDCWINLYNKGDFQEIHTHLPINSFSMVYFLDYDKNLDSSFYFYDPNSTFLLNNFKDIFGDLSSSVYFPNIEEGDVLIFPSFLHHGVKQQITNKKRITLACNFICNVI